MAKEKNSTLDGKPTGWYLPEAAHPYYALAQKYDIDFAAPAGPNPPLDPVSEKNYTDDQSAGFLQDKTVQDKLANAKTLDKVDTDEYIALFYPGGSGPVLDLAFDLKNAEIATKFYRSGRLVSAVCHGPAALVKVTDEAGKSIFAGKEATAFSDAEEAALDGLKSVPFYIEDEIQKLGGHYKKAKEIFESCVVISGKLITGQNPASSKGVGEEILRALTATT
ncbi:class I glutamine amidotransferase-like protein [Schizopora paradoxa]|uniref:D-lactate dehydratase n=1 Tax=Schizopora paradoxa TaxID=27342 RepID=A0A0H2RTN9_9AGAM|nr:class I glutamine amidotransferase-like protein [Schizopora paradoxa]